MLGRYPARQAAVSNGRVGVVDIGSNSIRLVVYEGVSRHPIPIFNEKVLCGLGRGLSQTGRLDPAGRTLALHNLCRFAELAAGMALDRIHVLATAAVREAEDGAEFAQQVRDRCGFAVSVISGEEEARLSAQGVLSGIPDATGVVGDLGGGSLELVAVADGRIERQATLPLGPLRLMGQKGARRAARAAVRRAIAAVPWLSEHAGQSFYAVGGAWRSLARMHMAQEDYPLHIIQQYAVPAEELGSLAAAVARERPQTLERAAGVSKRRIESLPYASIVLDEVIAAFQPAQVVFSAYGLREGLLFDALEPAERALDPLLSICEDLACRIDRFGPVDTIVGWTSSLADLLDPERDRWRQAACLLSDIGWAEHPDYRAEHAYLRVVRLPIAGLCHEGRVFTAASVAARYGASLAKADLPALSLLTSEDIDRASVIGAALRLAHTVTGGAALPLGQTRLQIAERTVTLAVNEAVSDLLGDVVNRRLDSLAKALAMEPDVVVEPDGPDPSRAQPTVPLSLIGNGI